jgi:CopG family transcriptional regulator, nickel-responsive regulator
MADIVRFGVSLEESLLQRFDEHIHKKKYTNRSEAIRDLIREELVRQQWRENSEVTGAITLVYDHHQRGLVSRLLNIQHDYHHTIFSTQHIHLDHDNCLEIIITKGKAEIIEALYGKLKSAKGVNHAGFAMATAGDISA